MGTPLPPNEPGNLCTVCWGPAKPFGPGPTPKYLQVDFVGLQPGQFWDPAKEQTLLQPHLLVQQIGPCNWQVASTDWLVTLAWAVGIATINLRMLPSFRFAFSQTTEPPCLNQYTNAITTGGAVVAFDGVAKLSWDLEGLL